ncbi:hypothetical protein MMC19_003694 [Ptychographa xylographoides]|nr:hypothetical protein [Ptychographa xylographoides]
MQRLTQSVVCRHFGRAYFHPLTLALTTKTSLDCYSTTARLSGARRGLGLNRTFDHTQSARKLIEEEYLNNEGLDKEGLADEILEDEEDLQDARTKALEEMDETEDPEELRQKILQLEEELDDLRSGKSLSALPAEERRKVEQVLERARPDGPQPFTANQYKWEPTDDYAEEEAQYLQDQADLEIKFKLSQDQDAKLRNLTDSLRDVAGELAANELSVTAGRELWRSYALCRQIVPSFFELVPNIAWKVLWESQYKTKGSTKDRAEHLMVLLQDMQACGKELTSGQKLVYIESLHAEGRHSEAISTWQSNQSSLANDKSTAQYYENLGVRIFASAGDPQKAQDLAFGYFQSQDDSRARILIPLIEAWARKKDNYGIKQAWSIYLQMRLKLGSQMTLEDYDDITMCFLNTGNVDIALAVFKDLMLTGQESQYDSTALYRTSLGLFNELNSRSTVLAEVTNTSLTALTVLPKKFQNKFFFGSWMKKLIGMGQVDAAVSVLQLMVERGVKADPKHLNGVIAALLRTGNPRNKEKGVQMGWAMIQERLRFVAHRKNHDGPKELAVSEAACASATPGAPSRGPTYLSRITVPPATIETYSILLLYFQRRGMSGAVQQLKDSLQLAAIAPNAYFMNHLIYAEIRQGQYQKAWNTYLKMSVGTQPDLETFAALWDCEKAYLDRPISRTTDKFPSPRHIFCDMMGWFSKKKPKEREVIQEEFSRDIYDQIVRCMCLAKDLEGTLVAMYALEESFQEYPDENSSRMIALQLARIGEQKPKITKRHRRRAAGNDQSAVNVEKVATVTQVLMEEREEQLQAEGIIADDLTEEQNEQEALHLLATLIRTFLESLGYSDEMMHEKIEKAAWEMGASGLEMADPLLEQEEDIGEGNSVD